MKKLWILLMCLGLLSACAPTAEQAEEPGVAVSAQTQQPTGDTAILTVDGQSVYWSEFNYYLTYISDYYKSANGIERITDVEDYVLVRAGLAGGVSLYDHIVLDVSAVTKDIILIEGES